MQARILLPVRREQPKALQFLHASRLQAVKLIEDNRSHRVVALQTREEVRTERHPTSAAQAYRYWGINE